jgi:hypothetical protein
MSNPWERTPIANSPVSVVLLRLDENDAALRQSLAGLSVEVKKLNQAIETLLPCTPTQASSLQSLIADYPQVRLVEDESTGQGVGSALKVGIAAAHHPLIFTLATGYEANLLSLFLKEIDLVDIVCGVRKDRQKRWRWRQFFSVAYQLFGLSLQDPECPVRLYRRESFERIPIQSQGAFALIEILAKANFESKLLTEVVIYGPLTEPALRSGDFWKVLNRPDFGPPLERVIEPTVTKPIITTQAPETISH